ncbi:hypothetical protein [Nocardioides sp. SR21]|uniref:hypothetical protein n=1 Tax=Nocardioides sp. SR21 TaxID=2919501 RepID=UPI001FA97EFF|nr:hypothetical protein [Nocardioides sp. SR21]
MTDYSLYGPPDVTAAKQPVSGVASAFAASKADCSAKAAPVGGANASTVETYVPPVGLFPGLDEPQVFRYRIGSSNGAAATHGQGPRVTVANPETLTQLSMDMAVQNVDSMDVNVLAWVPVGPDHYWLGIGRSWIGTPVQGWRTVDFSGHVYDWTEMVNGSEGAHYVGASLQNFATAHPSLGSATLQIQLGCYNTDSDAVVIADHLRVGTAAKAVDFDFEGYYLRMTSGAARFNGRVGTRATVYADLQVAYLAKGMGAPDPARTFGLLRCRSNGKRLVRCEDTGRQARMNVDGTRVSFNLIPQPKYFYVPRYDGDAAFVPSEAARGWTFYVHPTLTLQASRAKPMVGDTVTISGLARPCMGKVRVDLQVLVQKKWRKIASVKTGCKIRGLQQGRWEYGFRYRPNVPGTHTLRVFVHPGGGYVAGASGKVVLKAQKRPVRNESPIDSTPQEDPPGTPTTGGGNGGGPPGPHGRQGVTARNVGSLLLRG